MKKNICIFIFMLYCMTVTEAQCHDTCQTCTIQIDYLNCGLYLSLNDTSTYSLRTMLSDTSYKFYKVNCFGTLKFYKYEEKKMTVYGEYKGLDNLVQEPITEENGFTGEKILSTHKFYKPVRHGTWIFYRPNGVVYKEEYWEDGVLIKVIDK